MRGSQKYIDIEGLGRVAVMPTGSMMNLIAKLEAATEGSYELNKLIWLLPNTDPDVEVADGTCPHYTTSIDAALTLVPENHWFICNRNEERDICNVNIGPHNPEEHSNASAPTLALAICIAALKARAALAPHISPKQESSE